MADNTKTSVPFSDEEIRIIAQLVAQREGLLQQALLQENHEEHKRIWAEIYRSVYKYLLLPLHHIILRVLSRIKLMFQLRNFQILL
jgi:GAF domain-containing protein